MEILGYCLSLLIGLSLGLVGSGGSILAVPVLVYVVQIQAAEATGCSLFVVGVSALIGSLQGVREKLIDLSIAIYFGLPSVLSVFVMRRFVMPNLPNILFQIGDFTIHKNLFIMLVFAVLMLLAASTMMSKASQITNTNLTCLLFKNCVRFLAQRSRCASKSALFLNKILSKIFGLFIFSSLRKTSSPTLNDGIINRNALILRGFLVGILTGFVGVGGGFLIIPTLVFSAKLQMKNAVATSLIIIACNALIGFAGSIGNLHINWSFLLLFTSFAVIGILFGQFLSKKISNEKLKPAFGWFVLAMGIYILIKEILF